MSDSGAPCEENDFLLPHAKLMRDSYRLWTERELIPSHLTGTEAARYLFHAPFAVLSHDATSDPAFTYANNKAMKLFEMEWDEIVGMASRLSAESGSRESRERALKSVNEKGFVDGYSGIRIAASGRRFRIANTTIWNLVDMDGEYAGQAALFDAWTFIPAADDDRVEPAKEPQESGQESA